MRISYKDQPIENSIFGISAYEIAGRATFEAELDGEAIWNHGCDDPPCHEAIRIPPKSGGKKLLITVKDSSEQHELLFFINDDGTAVLQSQLVREFAPV